MDRSTYQVHYDLLAQVADSAAEEAHVRRVLSSPLTEADLDAHEKWKRAPFAIGATNHAHRHSRPACSRCESGMTHCVTPEACERAEAAARKLPRGDAAQRCITGIVILVTAALMVAAIVHGVLIVAGVRT